MIMADAKGHGYQRPSSPAPVSAPGRLSQRTDGGPGAMQGAKYVSGLPYGEGAEFQDVQSMAPMEAAPKTAASAKAQAVAATQGQGIVPLSAPSQRPNEPVTAGAALGAGPGIEALGLDASNQQQQEIAQARLDAYRPVLMYLASRPDTSPETRAFINQLVG